jgi:hypothetical protein
MFGPLTAQLVDIEKRQRQLDAERAEVIAAWVRTSEWGDDGSASAAARLARTTNIPGVTARERVRISTLVLSSMPHTAEAMDDLGWPKVRLLANAINARTRAHFERDEAALVEQALKLTPDLLAVLLRLWLREVDEDGANADADARHEGRYLEVTTTFDGDVLLRGRFDAESGAIVKGVLDQIADELYRSDRRANVEAMLRGDDRSPAPSAAERLHDAAVEMACRAAATTHAEADGAIVEPAAPLVSVVMDVDAWGEAKARLADGSPLPTTDAIRSSCEAAVARVVTKDGVVPLELGRTVRNPSRAQRRALAAIWRTCAHPSCDRPFAWCQLHHVIWWERGGRTDIGSLVPLCSKHHRLHHSGVFDIRRRPDGTFVFHKADGTEIGAANPTVSQLLGAIRDLARAG